MVTEKKLFKIMMEIYRKMYSETDPPANIDEISASGEGMKPNWFLEYYLPINRQEEIIAEVCKSHNISKIKTQQVSVSVHLGCAPRGYPKEKEVET